MSQVKITPKQRDLNAEYATELKTFMESTVFAQVGHERFEAYKAFALSFESPKSAKCSTETFIDLLANTSEAYTLAQMQVILTASENRTLADYSRTAADNALDGYCLYLKEMKDITATYNAMVKPEVTRLQGKYDTLSKLTK